MKISIPFIVLWLLVLTADAQLVNIPDANFKNALLNHSPVINTNGDGEIQLSEAMAFTGNLNVFYKDIIDLTGIEAFSNIQSLDCGSNKLTAFPFGNFTNLTTLDCHSNRLTVFPLSSFPALKKLDCASNKLTSLIFNNSFTLTSLNCSANQLTTLIITNVSILRELNCFSNQLTSLTIGNAPLLEIFACVSNKLVSLSIGDAPILTSIICYNNKLTSVTLGSMPSLETFHCKNNKLTSLPNFSSNVLKVLYCDNNNIDSLSLSNYPSLARVECYSGKLKSINLSNLPMLSLLICYNNQLSSVILNNLPSLSDLNFSQNQLTSLTISGLTSLKTLGISQNPITSLMLSNLPLLKAVSATNTLLQTVDLSQTPVQQFTCSGNPNLQYINLKNGKINTVLNLFSTPALKSICADETEINFINSALASKLPGQDIVVSSFCNFNPDGNYNTITGNIRFDIISNGCDDLDSSMYNVKVKIDDAIENGITYTNTMGNYKFFALQNTNVIKPEFENPYFTITPLSHTITFTGFGNTQVADFCITPNGNHPDLEITLLPITPARPGFDAQYLLVYRNKGNQLQSGSVYLSFDDVKLNFSSSIPNTTSQTNGNLVWSFAGLLPYETRTITFVMHVNAPPVVNIGDIIPFIAEINPIPGDETPADNTFNFTQVARGAFDPNDKEVVEGSSIDITRSGEYLHYMIRFQNTGNEPAISIVIRDLLSDNLDWNSLVPVAASHPYRTVIDKGNKVEFIFDGINLPGKITDEPGSHGFIAFKIKPKSTITIGETINNKAEIYFDYNLPVITNTASTTITRKNKIDNVIGLSVFPNPAQDFVWFAVNEGVQVRSINLYNSTGEKIYTEAVENNNISKKINIANFSSEILFLEVISIQGRAVQKVIRLK